MIQTTNYKLLLPDVQGGAVQGTLVQGVLCNILSCEMLFWTEGTSAIYCASKLLHLHPDITPRGRHLIIISSPPPSIRFTCLVLRNWVFINSQTTNQLIKLINSNIANYHIVVGTNNSSQHKIGHGYDNTDHMLELIIHRLHRIMIIESVFCLVFS